MWAQLTDRKDELSNRGLEANLIFEMGDAICIATWGSAMNKPMSFQTILGANGLPAFVVVPYSEFIEQHAPANSQVPDAVVLSVLEGGMSPAKAWRTHLELTPAEVAQRMGISQDAYAQLEAQENPRKGSREKIALALGISSSQLDL